MLFRQVGPKPDDIIHHVITANKKNAVPIGTAGEDRVMYMMDDVMTIFLVIVSNTKSLKLGDKLFPTISMIFNSNSASS